MCEACFVNGLHAKNLLNIQISTLRFIIISGMFWRNFTKIRRICIPYKFAQSGKIKSYARFSLVKVPNQLAPHLEIMTPDKTANQWNNRTSESCLSQ